MGETTRFGGGRHSGTGHLVHSQRIGPAVVVVHSGAEPGWIEAVAADLNEDGFTVLVPDLFAGEVWDVSGSAGLLREAVTHMRMNWHPRVGIVCFGGEAAALAADVGSRAGCDALVVFGTGARPDGEVPALVQETVEATTWGEALEFLHHYLA